MDNSKHTLMYGNNVIPKIEISMPESDRPYGPITSPNEPLGDRIFRTERP